MIALKTLRSATRSTVRLIAIICCVVLSTALISPCLAQQPPNTPPWDLSKIPTRELRVPVKDLQALLTSPNQRVLLTRGEYEKLLTESKLTPEAIAQARAVLEAEAAAPSTDEFLHATHQLTVEGGIAVIESEYKIELFKDGWTELPIDFTNVQILTATLDDATAWLKAPQDGRQGAGLVLRGKGLHRLKLRSISMVAESSAQQALSLVLPSSLTSQWSMQVPGNVEILSGASVLDRVVEEASNQTQFKIVPAPAPEQPSAAALNLAMTLNNKLAKDQSLVDVRSQQLVHRTTSVENVAVIFELRVLQGGESKFEVEIPDGFEIQTVLSPWMSKWGIQAPDPTDTQSAKRLVIDFREPVVEQASVVVSATKTHANPIVENGAANPAIAANPANPATPSRAIAWRVPRWNVLGVSRHDALVAIGLGEDLKWKEIQSDKLIAIAPDRFQDFAQRVGWQVTDPVRIVFAGYSPAANFSLQASLEVVKKLPKIDAMWQMVVADREVQLSGRLTVTATQESLDRVLVKIPSLWRLQQVFDGAGRVILWEKQTESSEGKDSTFVIKLPGLLRPGQAILLRPEWAATPEGWLANWNSTQLSFPKAELQGLEVTRTVLSVNPVGDLTVEQATVAGLDPLMLSERQALEVASQTQDSLAFVAQQTDWSLSVTATKKKASLIAEAFTYANASPSGLKIQHEIAVTPEQASVEELLVVLPERTPAEIAIRATGGPGVKSYSQSTVDGKRTWTIRLQAKTNKPFRLLFDYRLANSTDEVKLPIPKLANAAYQSGLVAVDRDDAMEVSVRTGLRRADVGELTDSSLAVGASFLGVFGYPAYEDVEPEVAVKVITRELSFIPPTIAESLKIQTWVSNQQWSYHQATFAIRTATDRVAIRIPEVLELWAVTVDGKPSLPQRDGDVAIIELRTNERSMSSLPGSTRPSNDATSVPATSRTLVLTYAIPVDALGLQSKIRLIYPELLSRGTSGQTVVPLSDLNWTVRCPMGYELVSVVDGIAQLSDCSPKFPWTVPTRIGNIFAVTIGSIQSKLSMVGGTAESFDLAKSSELSAPRSLKEMRAKTIPFSTPQSAAVPTPSPPGQASPAMDDLFGAPAAMLPTTKQVRRSSEASRSLALAVATNDQWQSRQLSGLGSSTTIEIQIVQAERWKWLAFATAAWIVVLFVAYWKRPFQRLWRIAVYLAMSAVIAALILPDSTAIATIGEALFWAVIVMISLKAVQSLWRLSTHKTVTRVSSAAASLALVVMLNCSASTIAAQPPIQATPQQPIEIQTVQQMIEALRSATTTATSVTIPMNAIVVPYDASASLKANPKDEKLLVPLSTFEYLQTVIRGGEVPTPPNTSLSLGPMDYRATLESGAGLTLTGSVAINNPTQKTQQVPLAISNAVLVEALLDGQPATIYASGENFVLSVPPSSKEQRFSIRIQTKTSSQAGWQSVQAIVPSAIVTRLVASVTSKDTEVRFLNSANRPTVATTKDGQELETGIIAGNLALQWRPKVAQVVTDESLQVESASTCLVLESGIQSTTRFEFAFRRGRRDEFVIIAPAGYRVDKVGGDNVKGWKQEEIEPQADVAAATAEAGSRIRVSLLKTAVEKESLTVTASRLMEYETGVEKLVDLPVWRVPEAQTARGSIQLLASQGLTAAMRDVQGLTREDFASTEVKVEHPKPIAPLSAYRHARSEYQAKLSIRPATTKLEATVQSNLFVSRGEISLKCELQLNILEGETNQVRLRLPAEWQWDLESKSKQMEMELRPSNDSLVDLIIRSSTPLSKQVKLSISGKQKRDSAVALAGSELTIPQVRVLDATLDRGTIVVWSDRGLEAVLNELNKLTLVTATPGSFNQVLASMQQKAILQYTFSNPTNQDSYSGKIRWQSLKPIIESITVCNVKLTKQSIEQTAYIEWLIKQAGVSELSFVLPASMRDAKVAAPMARKISRQPLNPNEGAAIRFTIELQDQILGDYRVLVQNDLPWSNVKATVPLVSETTGNVRHQFVTIENSGFDELVIDQPKGMQPLVRGDSYWNEFAKILGNTRVQAFRIDDAFNSDKPLNDDGPRLSFGTRARETVQTVNAKIGLATTKLSVDAQGNYRGVVEYRMENFSEPYLEIELPEESQLWSVQVADAPVKPGESSSAAGSTAQRFRIPLIRTQLGDLDYGIRLVYAGQLPKSKLWTTLELPFVKSINVQPEQSQLRLFLPPAFRWYRWEGTLGRVESEEDLTASWLSFRNKQIRGLSEILSQSNADEFSQSRAVENFKKLNDDVANEVRQQTGKGVYNQKLIEELGNNYNVVQEAKKQQEKVENGEAAISTDNRIALGNRFMLQQNQRANGNFELEKAELGKNEFQSADKSKDNLPLKPGYLPESEWSKPPIGQPPQPQVGQPQQGTSGNAYSQSAPINLERQQSDAKQMAQRYKNKIQSQNSISSGQAQQAEAGSGGFGGGRSEPGGMGSGGIGSEGMGPGGMGGLGGGLGGMAGGGRRPSGLGGEGGAGQREIEQAQDVTEPPANNAPAPPAKRLNQNSGGDPFSGQVMDAPMPPAPATVAPSVASASGLRSLEIDIPMRGDEYLFVTPKGEMKLVAYGVSKPHVRNWSLAGGALLLMLLLTRPWFKK